MGLGDTRRRQTDGVGSERLGSGLSTRLGNGPSLSTRRSSHDGLLPCTPHQIIGADLPISNGHRRRSRCFGGSLQPQLQACREPGNANLGTTRP